MRPVGDLRPAGSSPPLPGPARRDVVRHLPGAVRACLFDLDGVLTRTALVHAAAWKSVFDDYLAGLYAPGTGPFIPFDPVRDYASLVDGRAREDGARAFLASRGITLPDGDPDDPPGAETVLGLACRKNAILLRLIREGGVQAYPGSVRYVRAVRRSGRMTAVVSSSTNCRDVLEAACIADLFDARIDGVVAFERRLRGKPAPDTFLEGARALGVPPREAAVYEDSLAGVEAGRAGRFGWVVGVDRLEQAEALGARGADVVVSDLAELLEAV
ncbi:MAG: HAD-IA family hydrolase [Thermoleophilia bacterium]|nr:HAD-IA family hydrolase [Thermoleophilia bacterium]